MPAAHAAPPRSSPPPPPQRPPPRVVAAAAAVAAAATAQRHVHKAGVAATSSGTASQVTRLTRAVHLSPTGVCTLATQLVAYKDSMTSLKVTLSSLRDVLQTIDSVLCNTARVDAAAALTFARVTRTTAAAHHARRERELARMPEAALVIAEMEDGKELRRRQQQQLSQLRTSAATHTATPPASFASSRVTRPMPYTPL